MIKKPTTTPKLKSWHARVEGRRDAASSFESLETRTVLSGAAIVQPFAQVDDYGDSKDWALNAVNAPVVWAQGYTGQNVLVAVVDSGADMLHADLVDSVWSNAGEIAGNGIDDDGNGFIDDYHGWDFVADDASPDDEAGHGTHVAGIVVASRNEVGATGVAYGAQWMPVRVLDAQGNGSQFDIASGIRYAVDNGADIINVSLGGPTGSQRVERAIEHALNNNVLVVAASGNAANSKPEFPASYSSQFGNVISVGAFDSTYQIASFSNRVGTSGAIQIDGPGVSVYSTKMSGGFRYGSGTSYAASVVSGIAALMLSANPDLSSTELRDMLATHDTLDIAGTDSLGGVDAAFVVAAVAPAPPAAPIFVPGDTDGDGIVGMNDFLSVSRNFGKEAEGLINGDLNGDGIVEFHDFLILTRNFGVTSASASSTLSAQTVDEVLASEEDFGTQSSLNELI